jgi:hypothetical protein
MSVAATASRTLHMPPRTSDPPGESKVDTGGAIVVIGANGAGKTRLGTWLEFSSDHKAVVHRVSAQKSLSMPPSTSPRALEAAEMDLLFGYDQAKNNLAYKKGHRWGDNPETFLLNDFTKLMIYLFSEDYEKSIAYRRDSQLAKDRLTPPETKLDVVKRLWEQTLPHRELVIGSGSIQARLSGAAEQYSAADMSDGERVVFYLLGQCLAAPHNGVIIIDEPELHLHRSIQARLWDAIENERPDCLFVYLTHDLDFAASRIAAKKVWLKSHSQSGWDWAVVPESEDIPEDVLLSILGSRKPILFVEGDRSSLDHFIFSYLYPSFTVSPCGSCEQVIQATTSFSALRHLHQLDCRGIIDRDYRTDSEVTYLQGLHVSVLDVAEIENLFLTEGVLRIVASHLVLDGIAARIAQIKDRVFQELKQSQDVVIAAMAVRRLEASFLTFAGKQKGRDGLVQAVTELKLQLDPDAAYQWAEQTVITCLDQRQYTVALKIYSNKGLLAQCSHFFGLKPAELGGLIKRLLASEHGKKLVEAMGSQVPVIQV